MTVGHTSIETVSGARVDLANPKVEDFILTDIAWALSHEPRFSGHTVRSLPYTVGQHSVLVAELVEEALMKSGHLRDHLIAYLAGDEDALRIVSTPNLKMKVFVMKMALLHDGSEAYLRDLPTPVKNLPGMREVYGVIEQEVQDLIHKAFGLEDAIGYTAAHRIVRWADLYALAIEAYHLMPSRGSWWSTSWKLDHVNIQRDVEPREQEVVYREFLEHYEYLMSFV